MGFTLMKNEGLREIEDIYSGVFRDKSVWYCSALVVAGDEVNRNLAVCEIKKRFERLHYEVCGDFTAVKKISAMHNEIEPTIFGIFEDGNVIRKKIGITASPFDSRSRYGIKADMRICKKSEFYNLPRRHIFSIS